MNLNLLVFFMNSWTSMFYWVECHIIRDMYYKCSWFILAKVWLCVCVGGGGGGGGERVCTEYSMTLYKTKCGHGSTWPKLLTVTLNLHALHNLYSPSVLQALMGRSVVCFWCQLRFRYRKCMSLSAACTVKDIENLAIILVPLIMILSRGHTGQIKG